MSVIVQAIAKFTISPRVALEFTEMLANRVFGQHWVLPKEDLDEDTENNDQIEPPLKKVKQIDDMKFLLPTRQTISSWSRDGYMLNFKLLAEKVVKAKERGDAVVMGVDDSLKADGNKRYDVKTGHFTIVDKDRKRSTYSSGFSHNISHSGA